MIYMRDSVIALIGMVFLVVCICLICAMGYTESCLMLRDYRKHCCKRKHFFHVFSQLGCVCVFVCVSFNKKKKFQSPIQRRITGAETNMECFDMVKCNKNIMKRTNVIFFLLFLVSSFSLSDFITNIFWQNYLPR